jgi:diguanylate cyclase (GGDEF)-like protein
MANIQKPAHQETRRRGLNRRSSFFNVIDLFVPESTRKNRIHLWRSENLVIANLLVLCVAAAFGLVYHLLTDDVSATLCFVGAVVSLGVLTFFRLGGKLVLAREMLVSCVYGLLIALSFRLGGVSAPTILWLVVCPTVSVLVGGVRPGLVWLGTVLLTVLAFYVAEFTGFGFMTPKVSDMHMLYALSTLGLIASVALFLLLLEKTNADAVSALKEALASNHELAIRDELTKAFNRRHILELVEIEKSRAERHGSPFCVCLMDLDNFKTINDTRGHAAGDHILRHFADTAQQQKRSPDQFGRYGGEEFLLLLPETTMPSALAVAERIRECASRPGGRVGSESVTVSIGAAEHAPGETTVQLISRADAALYEAKRLGKNRVRTAPTFEDSKLVGFQFNHAAPAAPSASETSSLS